MTERAATDGMITRIKQAAAALLAGGTKDDVQLAYEKGYATGYEQAQVDARSLAESRLAQPKDAPTGKLRIEDFRKLEPLRLQFDSTLLPDAPHAVTPETVKAFRADALGRLSGRQQPTEDQWQAILSSSNSALVVGLAGTGKTFVLKMRVLLLHCYLGIPLDQITIITVTKDCRFELIEELTELFALWDVEITAEQGAKLVRTPRGVLVDIMHGIDPLADLVPFELYGLLEAGDVDGQPFDPRLNKLQEQVLREAYEEAFSSNEPFRAAVKALYRHSVTLGTPDKTPPKFDEMARAGSHQLDFDEDITREMTRFWHERDHWPVEGVEARLTPIDVLGRQVWTNGYLPELNAHIVLGLPKNIESRHYREGASAPLKMEAAAKRAFLQKHAPHSVVWVQSPEHLTKLLSSISKMEGNQAPHFKCRISGQDAVSDAPNLLFQVGSLVENLGLDPAMAINALHFPAGVTDHYFFNCLAQFWPIFESHIWNRPSKRMMTLNRLYRILGTEKASNLNGVNIQRLQCLQHILLDEFQDLTMPTGEFIKGLLIENRKRYERKKLGIHGLSIFACGDDFQTAHGTQGATPMYLAEFKRHFSAKQARIYLLDTNFRSNPGIVRSAHSLIVGIPAISPLAPTTISAGTNDNPVELHDLNPVNFMRLFDMHYGAGESILILAASSSDYRASEEFVKIVVERDKNENPGRRRVRVRAVGRSKGLEADTVFMLGDLRSTNSSWALNRLFHMAKTIDTQDQSPFDMIQQNELLRLAHIGITRAKQKCYWLLPEQAAQPGLKASTRIASVPDYFTDHRSSEI